MKKPLQLWLVCSQFCTCHMFPWSAWKCSCSRTMWQKVLCAPGATGLDVKTPLLLVPINYVCKDGWHDSSQKWSQNILYVYVLNPAPPCQHMGHGANKINQSTHEIHFSQRWFLSFKAVLITLTYVQGHLQLFLTMECKGKQLWQPGGKLKTQGPNIACAEWKGWVLSSRIPGIFRNWEYTGFVPVYCVITDFREGVNELKGCFCSCFLQGLVWWYKNRDIMIDSWNRSTWLIWPDWVMW